MPNEEKWERYFKVCNAIAAIATTLGLMGGGAFGLYTYYQQGLSEKDLKQQEIRLLQYNQKKEVYYELADAAAAVASSTNKRDAMQKAAKFSTLYLGRAHILAIDTDVKDAKIEFQTEMQKALKSDAFPSIELRDKALSLAIACRNTLRVEEIFSNKLLK